jgi:hypothetical protein
MAAVLTVALTMLGGGVGLYYATAGGKDPQAEKVKDPPTAPKAAKEKEPVRVDAEAKLETVRPKTAKEVQALLQKPSQFQQPLNGVPLKELLESLSDRFEVPIRIDSDAFNRMELYDAIKVYEQSVNLRVVRGMSVADTLREALAQVNPSGPQEQQIGRRVRLAYRIRDGQILIVPAYVPPYPTGVWVNEGPGNAMLPTNQITEQELGEPISLSVEDKPFIEVLEDLRRMTGANIVLDNRQKEQAKQTVSATFNDVRLLTVLRVLGDVCELKPVAMNNVFYVTSKENATRLQKEVDRERFGDPQLLQPSIGGSGLGGPIPAPTTEQPKEKKTKEE